MLLTYSRSENGLAWVNTGNVRHQATRITTTTREAKRDSQGAIALSDSLGAPTDIIGFSLPWFER